MKLTHHIKNILGIYKRACIFASSLLLLATSCTDDDIPFGDDSPEGPNPSIEAVEGDALAFTISLPSMQSSTRAVNYSGSHLDETYEDYVAPDKMYIFFIFNDDYEKNLNDNLGTIDSDLPDGDSPSEALSGDESSSSSNSPKVNKTGHIIRHLYTGKGSNETKAITFIPVEDQLDAEYKKWYFRLSFTELEEEGGQGNLLAKVLRENPFKIAVLANVDPLKPLQIKDTQFKDGSIELGDHINVIHHQTPKTGDNADPYTSHSDVYGFLYEGNSYNNNKVLGYYSDWVKNLNPSIYDVASARKYIRENWNPADDRLEDDLLSDYTTLWSIWNFGGNVANNKVPYGTTIPGTDYDYTMKYANQWNTRNGSFLRSKITSAGNGGTIDTFTTKDSKDDDGKETDGTPIYFVGGNGATAIYKYEDNGYFYGLSLPRITWSGTADRIDETNEEFKGYFHFKAHATGYLFITAKHNGMSTGSSIKVNIQKGYSRSSQNFTFKYFADDAKTIVNGVQTLSQQISITGDEQEVYFYVDHESGNGNNRLEIYQIEFVEDKYLFDTNRMGVRPEDQPIPMYGIQSFPKLKDFWEEGTLFDLTNYNNLSGDDFSDHSSALPLLRSVAKIEVRFPRSLGVNPDYVYLRSSNRTGRWEPLDVFTDTYRTWKDHIMDFSTGPEAHSRECEWFSIRYHTPFFEGGEKSTKGDETKKDENNNDVLVTGEFKRYQKKLAWYYGDWANNDNTLSGIEVPNLGDLCNGYETGYRGWGHEVYHRNLDKPGYPHVMNAMINRSDFTKFIYAGVDGIYDRFVLYTAEKFVDDPNDVGQSKYMISSDPKVCHIEFRLKSDPITNLDDNKCYRIYFIENGFSTEAGIPNLSNNAHTWEEQYEQAPLVLQQHWPIMRDHAYSFTVIDTDNRLAIVKLEVLPWRKVKDISVSW